MAPLKLNFSRKPQINEINSSIIQLSENGNSLIEMLKWYHPRTSSGKPAGFVHWHINFYKYVFVWPTENFKILLRIVMAFMILQYVHALLMTASYVFDGGEQKIISYVACICNWMALLNGFSRMVFVLLNQETIRKVFDNLYDSIYIPR